MRKLVDGLPEPLGEARGTVQRNLFGSFNNATAVAGGVGTRGRSMKLGLRTI